MKNWMDIESRVYMFCARRQPVVIVRGMGTRVWDVDGKEYLDFTAGWAVNSIGHCHPAVVEAVQEQTKLLFQTSNQFYTIPQIQLAEMLVEHSVLDRVFFANSGAEANEGAIKLARKYGKQELGGAYEIITALNSFHGRTLTTVTATGNPQYQEAFKPLPPGFLHVPFDNIQAIKDATSNNTCAVLLEPIQGEGGVITPSPAYLRDVRAWCDERRILLILDEVQTGMGRLGSLFGYELYGIEPDVLTLAKGLGGGLPIGAFLTKQWCDVLRPGDHGSTFGGNPVTCAAAHAVIKVIVRERLWEKAQGMGERLMGGLCELLDRYKGTIKNVRGEGLLQAVEFSDDISGAVVSACNYQGLLLNPVRPNTVRFMPPLTITASEVDQGLTFFEQGLKKVIADRE